MTIIDKMILSVGVITIFTTVAQCTVGNNISTANAEDIESVQDFIDNLSDIPFTETEIVSLENQNLEEEQDNLILAQCLLAEAGWNSPRDYAAILFTLQYRINNIPAWRGRRLGEIAKQYCVALRHSNTRNARHLWIREMTWAKMNRAPESFPSSLNFSRYSRQWDMIREFVVQFKAGLVENPCDSIPEQWGSQQDPHPAHWRRMNCGNTHNVYYDE